MGKDAKIIQVNFQGRIQGGAEDIPPLNLEFFVPIFRIASQMIKGKKPKCKTGKISVLINYNV